MNDLSLHVMDILQNSVVVGATRVWLTVEEDRAADLLRIVIADNGRGMTPGQVARLDDPFFTSRTTRRVGMGIPLFRQTAEQSGGMLRVESTPGRGTTVEATFGWSNIDRPPLGNIANTLILTVAAHPGIEFTFTYRHGSGEYRFDTVEIKEALDGVPMNNPQIMRMLEQMVAENIRELQGNA
jgi:hypothetical protein